MTNSRFKSGVPQAKGPAATDAASFIAGAPGKATLPWQAPGVRDDLKQDLNIEISERLKLKIDWLSHHTKTPKRTIAQNALEAYLDLELRRLGIQ